MAFGSLSSNQRVVVLMELLGGAKFAAEMKAASAETLKLAKAERVAARESALLHRRTFLTNQVLFTLRRLTFYASIAVAGLTVAVVKLGYSFLSAMQNAKVALTPVITNTQELNGYMTELFDIAKYSPFVISDLTKAFSAMYLAMHPIGISGQQIVQTMQSVTDYLSVLQQTTPRAMKRVTDALTDMAYQGQLTGRTFSRLGTIGIPIADILDKQLGIKNASSATVSQLNIPAEVVLKAINDYAKATKGIRNAARRQALGTFAGMLEVARDTLSEISGHLIEKAFGGPRSGIQGYLTGLLKPGGPLDKISKIQDPSKIVKQLSITFTGTDKPGKAMLFLLETAKNLGAVFVKVLLPAIGMAMAALVVFYPALKLLNILLVFMTHHTTIFKIVFAALIAEFILGKAVVGASVLSQHLFNKASKDSVPLIRALIRWFRLWRTVEAVGFLGRLKAITFATHQGRKANGTFGKSVYTNQGILAKFTRLLWRGVAALVAYLTAETGVVAMTWAWVGANLALVGIYAAVVLLIAGLVVLYFKWKPFHDLVNKTVKWLWSHPLAMWFIPVIGPLAVIVKYVIKFHKGLERAYNWLKMIRDIVAKPFNIAFHITGLGPLGALTRLATNTIPGVSQVRTATQVVGAAKSAHGASFHPGDIAKNIAKTILNRFLPFSPFAAGGITSGGMTLVGERGPELLNLPSGSRITPNQSVSSVLSSTVGGLRESRPIVVQVMLNRKVLAEAVAHERQAAESRRD